MTATAVILSYLLFGYIWFRVLLMAHPPQYGERTIRGECGSWQTVDWHADVWLFDTQPLVGILWFALFVWPLWAIFYALAGLVCGAIAMGNVIARTAVAPRSGGVKTQDDPVQKAAEQEIERLLNG